MMKQIACATLALCLLLVSSPVSFLAASTQCPTLSRTLGRSMRGNDVRALQQFLVTQGLLNAASASGFFGVLTQTAVQKWQAARHVASSGTPASTGYGLVGAKTRAAIQAACKTAPAPSSPASAAQSRASVPANPQCPQVPLPIGKPCKGTWKEAKDAKGCTASWQCAAQ